MEEWNGKEEEMEAIGMKGRFFLVFVLKGKFFFYIF